MKHASLIPVYRVVWNAVLDSWAVAPETATRRGQRLNWKLAAPMIAAILIGIAQAAPNGGQITAGAGSIAQNGVTTTVRQNSQNLSINWTSFNITPQETVNFLQPGANAIAVNRIYDVNGTQILGQLSANGQVYLINPNGVLFGRGAQVNVGGLVASTLDFNDASLAGRDRRFVGSGGGRVDNLGTIRTADGGYVALLGHQVSNQGTIVARLGSVAIGAGNAITLTFSDNHLLRLQVNQGVLNHLAENGGLIQADGGSVLLTAGARDALLASVVNNSGVIEARTVEDRGGTIVLSSGSKAGTVTVGGTLDASAPNGGQGGFIETSAAHVRILDGARVSTAAPYGQAGTWLIDPQDFTIAASGGDMTGAQLGASLVGGNVTIQSADGSSAGSGDVNVNDVVSWTAHKLTLSAWRDININSALNGSGSASLALEYGQGALAAGNAASYNIRAAVSLPAGNHFSSKLGSDGQTIDFLVINNLGAAGSLTGTDLQGINGALDGNFALGRDIDASPTATWISGFQPIGSSPGMFVGRFDGLGHTINRLVVRTGVAGLFGVVADSAEIRNLGLIGVDIRAEGAAGALAVENYGTISNVYATGSVAGSSQVGGLVGLNGGLINNSYTATRVSGTSQVGGLVGSNDGAISHSSATGSVNAISDSVGGLVGYNNGTIGDSYATSNVRGNSSVGGLVGYGDVDSTIDNSYASGNVSVYRGSEGGWFGGLMGYNGGTVSNSYALGSVVANTYQVGGLVGSNDGTIENSYATGSVSGSNWVGGLVGYSTGSISASHATGNVTGSDSVGGLVGYHDGAISNSFATGNVTGTTNLGGLVGTNAGESIGGEGVNPGGQIGARAGVAIQDLGSGLASITDSYATGNVTGRDYVGGLVGYNFGTIAASHATGSVTGGNSVGGLVGYADVGSMIDSSYASGNVSLTEEAEGDRVGGLVGYNGGAISNSYALGSVTANTSYVGGLVGSNDGTIENSYATGSVSGSSSVGGLVGYNNGPISSSYATGSVSGANSVGGLVGYADVGSTIDGGYASGNVTGGSEVGGLVGYNGGAIRNSYAISNVTAYAFYTDSTGGLVGYNEGTIVSSYATGNISGNHDVGGLVGYNQGAISSSYATGTVTGRNYVGGLVGYHRGAIESSHASGSVNGDRSVGGLVGFSFGTISNSYATGDVTGRDYVGGLVGNNETDDPGDINSSYATGNVSGDNNVGGLVGWNDAFISSSYAIGNVRGSDSVGGLVGHNRGVITYSYAVGEVTTTCDGDCRTPGGLVGSNLGTVTHSFWDMATSGQTRSSGGTGMRTSAMQLQANFTSATSNNGNVDPTWDFSRTWVMYDGHTYPLLRVFMTPLTVLSAVKTYDGQLPSGAETVNYSAPPDPAHLLGTLQYGGPALSARNVGAYPASLGGLYSDQQGYIITYDGQARLTINPATLTYTATAQSALAGQSLDALTGSVIGLVAGETLASATTGSVRWISNADVNSPPGSYAIYGSGLSAENYVFVQASGNASALTLLPPQPVTTTGGEQPAVVADQLASLDSLKPVPLRPSSRLTLRYGAPPMEIARDEGARCFGRFDAAGMSRDALARLLDCRREFKSKLFAEAIRRLEQNPGLADVPSCPTPADAATGLCRITDEQLGELAAGVAASRHPGARVARLPKIEHKIAVFFGIDEYDEPQIPTLDNAIADAEAMARLFATRLGYEVQVVRNATRSDIVRTLNRLALASGNNDSVLIYYAGHGLSVETTGEGYWIPSDGLEDDPVGWISNRDITKLLANVRARQIVMISDSCYSGAFTREGQVVSDTDLKPDDVLNKRSVVVLSSGGDEPVADAGREGHSFFAWHLMDTLGNVQNWQPGKSVFATVRRQLLQDFPQTANYGAILSAGHQQGGDYLFEFRELDVADPLASIASEDAGSARRAGQPAGRSGARRSVAEADQQPRLTQTLTIGDRGPTLYVRDGGITLPPGTFDARQ